MASLPDKAGDSGWACPGEIKQTEVNALAISEHAGPTMWNYPDGLKSSGTVNSLVPVLLDCVYVAWSWMATIVATIC